MKVLRNVTECHPEQRFISSLIVESGNMRENGFQIPEDNLHMPKSGRLSKMLQDAEHVRADDKLVAFYRQCHI